MRRAVWLAALVAALCVPVAPALADDTVVVPGLAFPATDTYLTYFGCTDLYHADTRGPRVRIDVPDAGAPAGRRTFGLRMPGTGTASGPVRRVESVAATTVAGFSARAPEGSAGVAYVWMVTPGLTPGQAWAGRADLQVGSAWQSVDAAAATYRWTLYDAPTGQVLQEGGAQTIAGFTAVNGDGPGYLLAGFGCDGHEFSVDALRFGRPGVVTTYDLEGLASSTVIRVSSPTRPASGEVIVTGVTLDVAGVPLGSSLVLEARAVGTQAFRAVTGPLYAGPDGTVSTVVAPEATTEYRWYAPETGYADESWSGIVRVRGRVPSR